MSWTRRLIWAFWIFIAVMLLWQFYTFNAKISAPPEHPKPDHYFFYQGTKAAEAAAAAAVHESAYVEQTGFTVENNTPNSSAFTCHVTLKNTGKTKAINVEVCVRPFRGAMDHDPDSGGNQDTKPVADNSPLGQMNQWVAFPDLGPGESSTQSVVFMKVGNPPFFGDNPKPEISFQPEKK
ncbi:MAG TPA: hypothetical protein VHY09_00750 [Candidatus Methylacidiphilales bacterium]|nr:hypothetical protein [Candidatus Methylacidiphilales bacterium]